MSWLTTIILMIVVFCVGFYYGQHPDMWVATIGYLQFWN